MKQNNLTLLSFNAGLLLYDLLQIPFFTPVPYIKERLLKLPSEILKENADIVFLQEVYHIKHKKFLEESLKKHYPYYFYIHKGYRFKVENGLVIFSKFPLNETKLIPFQSVRLEEKFFAQTGYLRTTVNFPEKSIAFYNIHLTAGGILGPEHKKVEKLRQTQIEQLLKDTKENQHKLNIIVGDFNCGPDVSFENYEIFLKENFTHLNSKLMTWDPLNPLNEDGIHKHCPPQCIDHVFLNKIGCDELQSYQVTRVFDKPVVKIEKEMLTISDHYGVKVELKFS